MSTGLSLHDRFAKMADQDRESPVNTMSISPRLTSFIQLNKWERNRRRDQWTFWCQIDIYQLFKLLEIYNVTSITELQSKIHKIPESFHKLLNKIKINEWPVLFVVFYSMCLPCNIEHKFEKHNCGFYHKSINKRMHKYIKLEKEGCNYYLYYNTLSERNIRTPENYKSVPCHRDDCSMTTCSFYHSIEERFSINEFNGVDFINSFIEVEKNEETRKIAESTSNFLLK